MKLNKQQEKALMDLGVLYLLQQHFKPGAKAIIKNIEVPKEPVKKKVGSPKWTEARRRKFAATMKKKWAAMKKSK